MRDDSFRCTHHAQQVLGVEYTEHADDDRHRSTEPDRLTGDLRRGIGIFRSDSARNHGCDAHAETDGDRVKHRDQRLCNADRGHGIRAKS